MRYIVYYRVGKRHYEVIVNATDKKQAAFKAFSQAIRKGVRNRYKLEFVEGLKP